MIQLFLIIIILVILICIFNTKESFYFDECSKRDLNALNTVDDNDTPCIELFFDKVNDISKAFIVIKNKHTSHEESPLFLDITHDISDTNSEPTGTTIASPTGTTIASPKGTTIASPKGTTIASPKGTTIASPKGTTIASCKPKSVITTNRDNKQIIQLTENIPYLQLGNTYLITLNIKPKHSNFRVYETLEITFKDVKLAENNLNKTNSNILNILKNKKINFII